MDTGFFYISVWVSFFDNQGVLGAARAGHQESRGVPVGHGDFHGSDYFGGVLAAMVCAPLLYSVTPSLRKSSHISRKWFT